MDALVTPPLNLGAVTATHMGSTQAPWLGRCVSVNVPG